MAKLGKNRKRDWSVFRLLWDENECNKKLI